MLLQDVLQHGRSARGGRAPLPAKHLRWDGHKSGVAGWTGGTPAFRCTTDAARRTRAMPVRTGSAAQQIARRTSAQNSWRRRSSASHQPRVTVVSWEEGEATWGAEGAGQGPG